MIFTLHHRHILCASLSFVCELGFGNFGGTRLFESLRMGWSFGDGLDVALPLGLTLDLSLRFFASFGPKLFCNSNYLDNLVCPENLACPEILKSL